VNTNTALSKQKWKIQYEVETDMIS